MYISSVYLMNMNIQTQALGGEGGGGFESNRAQCPIVALIT